MNLHAIVRGLITRVHPDEPVELIQCAGVENLKGVIRTTYAEPVPILANIQPTGEPLEHTDGMNVTPQTEDAYLFSNASNPVKGITRLPMARTGDFLRRGDGTLWRVTDVLEDWSADGWAKVRITQQVEGLDDA